jgi:hypothetical protein
MSDGFGWVRSVGVKLWDDRAACLLTVRGCDEDGKWELAKAFSGKLMRSDWTSFRLIALALVHIAWLTPVPKTRVGGLAAVKHRNS